MTYTYMATLKSMVALVSISLAAAASAGTQPRAPAQVIPGSASGEFFGSILNAEADLDRDGYNELIVSSSTGSNQRGKVEIFRGSRAGLSTTPSFSYVGPMDWAQAGASPVVADFNGDGWPDLLIGAPNWSGAQTYAGAVLFFAGSKKGFPSKPTQVIEGPSTNSFFGFVIRSLGDFNGDGRADVAISALGANSGAGNIYIYSGSASGLSTTPTSTLTGKAPWLYFGRVMDAADFDGDGIVDLAVGRQSPTAGIPGMTWIYKGHATGYDNTATDRLFAVVPDDSDYFGDTVSALGDIDGDGYPDLAVGAPYHLGAGGFPTGLITVYFGSGQGLGGSGRTQVLYGDGVPNMFMLGGNVRGRRDMNGDGRPDLLVGPTMYGRPNDENLEWPGSVWVYYAGPTGLSANPQLLASGAPGSRDEVGTSLEAGQVLSSKGLDLIAGSGMYNANGMSHSGILRIYRGRK